MRNIEIKARLLDRPEAEARLRALGAREAWTARQTDTFFAVPQGWLKVREAAGRPAEVISYRRSTSEAGPRPSEYDVLVVPDGEAWRRLLGRVLPVRGAVRKERTLWLHLHTRVHLDRVEGLGEFLELESLVEGSGEAEARAEADVLLAALGKSLGDLVPVPYLELLGRG